MPHISGTRWFISKIFLYGLSLDIYLKDSQVYVVVKIESGEKKFSTFLFSTLELWIVCVSDNFSSKIPLWSVGRGGPNWGRELYYRYGENRTFRTSRSSSKTILRTSPKKRTPNSVWPNTNIVSWSWEMRSVELVETSLMGHVWMNWPLLPSAEPG